MSKEELKAEIKKVLSNKPKHIRDGQAIFTYVDEVYGVARKIQYGELIDCFYNDNQIEDFLDKTVEYVNRQYDLPQNR